MQGNFLGLTLGYLDFFHCNFVPWVHVFPHASDDLGSSSRPTQDNNPSSRLLVNLSPAALSLSSSQPSPRRLTAVHTSSGRLSTSPQLPFVSAVLMQLLVQATAPPACCASPVGAYSLGSASGLHPGGGGASWRLGYSCSSLPLLLTLVVAVLTTWLVSARWCFSALWF